MADNFDNYSMKVQARVDLPSNKDIDAQIRKLEKNISKLKVRQFDDTALRNLTNQLNTLKANITTANFSPTALTELTNQVNRALQNINIGNINVGGVGNQAQQVGQQIGDTVEKSVQQSLSIDDVIDKQVTDLMTKYSIAGKKGSKAFDEIRQAIVGYRKELVNANSADIDPDDIFSIIGNSADINKVSSALANHMKVADATKDTYASLAEYIKHVNNSGTKIHLPESIRQEYGDDFASMRSQLGKAFTTGHGGDFESFITELNGQLGNVIDMSQGAEAAFGDLVQKVNSAKGGNFLSGDELFKQGYLDRNEIERDITSAIDIIEEEEKKLAQVSTATANTVVQNEQKKQQAYQQTTKVQSSVDNPDLDISDNEQKIEQFKDSLKELGTVDSRYVDKLSERFENLGIQIQTINASLSEVAVHEKGEYKGTKEILSTTLRGLDKNGQAITLMESWDLTNHEFVKSLDGVGASFENVSKYITDYQIKLNNLKTKYSNLDMNYSNFEKMLVDFGKGIGTIDDLRLAFNNLENSAKKGIQSLKSQTSSFDPIQQTLNNMRDLPSMLTTLEANMGGIKDKTSIAEISVADLRNTFNELETEMTNSGGKVPLTDEWLIKYRELMSTVTSATKQVDALKKAEASDNSQATKQANYYSTVLSNYKEIYSLKKKLITAGEEETKVIQEQINSLNSSNASIYKQLGKQGLKDNDWQVQVDDLKEELDFNLRISEARQKDKANQSKLNEEQRKSVQIVEELEKAYQRVQDIKIKIASLDKEKDGEKISTLSQEEKSAQDEYNKLYNRLRKRKNYDKESWNETKSAIDAATKSQIEFNNSKSQDALNKAQKTEVSNFNILKNKWEEQGILVGEFKEKVESMESSLASVGSKGELDNLKLQIKDLKAEASQIAEVNKIQLSTDITKLETDYRKFGVVSEEVENNLKELKIARENALKSEGTENASVELENYNRKLAETKSSWNELKATQVSANQRTSQMTEMQEWMRKNKNATALVGEQVEKLIEECKTCDAVRFNGIKNEFKDLQVQAGKAGKLGNTLWGSLVEQGKSFIQWTGVSGVVMNVTNKVREAVSELKNLDDILTEISKTSDLTEQQIKKLGESSFEAASEFGKKASDYLNNVTEMYRAGFDNAEEMAQLSLLAQAAGDLDSSASDDYLLATNAAYNYKGSVEELNNVLDRQNYITNNAAVNMQDMSDATSEAASVASAYGVKIEELSALIAVAVSKTRESGSEVGNALKSIFINLQDTTNNSIVEAFDAVGISMTKVVDGTELLKTPIELIKELSEAYNSLPEGDARRANILSDIASKYHANTFAAILEDLDSYYDMLELYNSTSAEGSALTEAEKSANNLSGSLNKLSNSFTEIVNNVLNADELTTLVNIFNEFLGLIDIATEKLGLLGTAGVALGAGLGIKNAG